MNKHETNEIIELLLNAATKYAQKGISESQLKLFFINNLPANELDLSDFETVVSDFKQAFTLAEKALTHLIQYREQAGTLDTVVQ